MEQYLPQDHHDRIQRALNESKRNELKDRFGMTFDRVAENVPPEMEADFLSYVEEFERQWENRRTITVRKFLNEPDVRPFNEIPEHELAAELARLTAIMHDYDVRLDFICPVSDEIAYRFIVDELFDQEIDDIRIDGMTHAFIYEEFHPNALYDISTTALDVAEGLIQGCSWKVDLYCTNELRIGDVEHVPIDDACLRLVSPILGGAIVTSVSGAVGPCWVNGEKGWAEVAVGWKGMMIDSGEAKEGRFRWKIEMEMLHGELWVVAAINPIV